MATLTIRELDASVEAQLRARAAEHGRSMEEEAREILSSVVGKPENLYQSIRRQLAAAGIAGVDLEIPDREPMREPIDFSGSKYGTGNDE